MPLGAVTFDAVSLRTNTLSESVFPLLKIFLELLFWNALQDGRRMSLNVGNVGPSKRSSVLGTIKSRAGPNLANMVDSPIAIYYINKFAYALKYGISRDQDFAYFRSDVLKEI
jgi:hypothetical protein